MQNLDIDSSINKNSKGEKELMLFDLSIYGHHPSYIQHFIEYWTKQNSSESLYVVVSPKFLQVHADVVERAKNYSSSINFLSITTAEEAKLKARTSGINRNIRAFQEWYLLCKYATTLQVSNCLIMYLDTCLLPLALGIKPPCQFSGIYFRPTFHYPEFSNYSPSFKQRLQHWREKFILKRALRHSRLQTLFSLDPFAVEQINSLHSQAKVVHLPDPVTLPNGKLSLNNLKQHLRIDENRKVFLLFGALTGRKGIYQLLDAVVLLPTEVCQKLCLLFVGESSDKEKAAIAALIATARQAKPIQIVEYYQFVPEQDVQAYFQLADVVLAPYQNHVGMSGILLLAAAAQKPVLSSNYGLMGEIVRRYRLGVTVDSTKPNEIAKGLAYCLQSLEKLGDRHQMELFANQNTAEKFARTILQNL